ncbi:ubiquitin carboxyl-terminal hydrolase 25 isoform X4 [Narcine bancroftii]|uniref:ubiquitin carboxyl-terminal hydrolase 25 isoform X4 n=1 Tax=Narcine bancroftii TaxID=1343680 RepID=UPI00383216BA
MTVEQNVLQPHSQKHQQTLLNQLREVTGTSDIQLLQQALQASNGDLAEAVAFLTEKNAKAPQQEETYYHTGQTGNDRYISVGSQADTNVIDLTGDDKDDLQRAIALSLEESNRAFRETGITDEEQAISRVLEASIAENKASLKRTQGEVWSDSLNPHDRKRQENCPVGLKNVGNTCWFSAVIQSLFNLLKFRRLVLNYVPPTDPQNVAQNQKERRNLPFMRELRHLFALMVSSKRKYVDPSRAVEILKDTFKSNDLQQQDVSEFTHKLLDWLEDAFQVKAEEERDGEKPKNPMVELFYGRFLAVGMHEGKKFENSETFGQYPLQVNGFKDLHECLEAAMVEGEIESVQVENSVTSAKSGQEHWFTALPPVLTFELSRFEFNQALGRPEKIHHKLEFPSLLYMDRYMDKNREITRIKREEIRRLKEHLTVLQQRLESPPELGPVPLTEAPCTPPLQRPIVHKPFTQSRVPPEIPMHPAPRHITEDELRVLEGCLHRWRMEVENDTRDLQESIARLHRTIELMYTDKTMMQVPYRLHAVLVHEGQANAGHYWAYIHDHRHEKWMKYNDVAVTRSSWEELERDSFGGYRNASAYCLMYINDTDRYLIEEEFDKETGQALTGMNTLPSDLKEYVRDDNRKFEKELQEWDAQQEKKAQMEKLEIHTTPREPATAISTVPAKELKYLEQPTANQPSKICEADTARSVSKAATECEDQDPEAALQAGSAAASPKTGPSQRVVEVEIPHIGRLVIESEEGGYDDEVMLTPTMQAILMAIGKARNVYDRHGPEAGFFKAFTVEYSRLVRLAQEDTTLDNDNRLKHIVIYLLHNEAPKKIIERTLLEQFADRNLTFDERCRSVMKIARAKLELIKPKEVNMEEYERWHHEYRRFRETTVCIMIGLEMFQKKCFSEALIYLIHAYQYNKELLSKGMYRGHDEELMAHYRRECLLKLNEHAASLFESGDDQEVEEGLAAMNELVVPCLPLLMVDEKEEKDIVAVEDMRNRWCSYLGQEMEPNLQEKLTDFLPKLLDCSTEIKAFRDAPKLPSFSTHELCERYARVMASLSRTPADGR